MSTLLEQEIPCALCQHPNFVEVWSSINVREDSELKDIMLGGELNMAECVACKKLFYAEHFLLYHDPDQELMAFVYPFNFGLEREIWEEKTKINFEESQKIGNQPALLYPPLSFFGLDELIQLVEKEEEYSIQGQIVEVLGQQHHFPTQKIRPSVARRQKIPSVIPYKKDSEFNLGSIVQALKDLEQMNDRLFVYQDLLTRLQTTPSIQLEVS
jgi:hypothetical protein